MTNVIVEPETDPGSAPPASGNGNGRKGGLRRKLHVLKRKLTPSGPSAASVPLMEYVKYHAFSRFPPSFPQIMQVQTQYGCNARCVFCPMGREQNQIHGRMDDATFSKIVDEAIENGVKVFSPYLQNDPLVDRKMHERIEYIRERRGRKLFPKTKLITNGGLLTEKRAYDLINVGLEYIVFSVHGIDPTVYDDLMNGPRFETTIKNIERFVRIKDELGAKTPHIEVWAVRTKEVDRQLDEVKAFWKERNIRFKARELDNRAHPEITENDDLANEYDEWKFATHCVIPFWRAWILWNGDMVLCCVDWERQHVFGNIHENTIREIWNGEAYRAYRDRMRNNDFAGTLCEHCKGI
ncbi:MAG: radical SAM/SPASM domain-containing protein [Gemmatimonadales bacterium]